MKFLLDANMPRSSAALLQELGHECADVRDILPHGAPDGAVASYAREHNLVLITRDFDFADIRNYPPADFDGIIVIEVPDDAIVTQINSVVRSFVGHPKLLERLPGRLAIVESWRVRFRPHG